MDFWDEWNWEWEGQFIKIEKTKYDWEVLIIYQWEICGDCDCCSCLRVNEWWESVEWACREWEKIENGGSAERIQWEFSEWKCVNSMIHDFFPWIEGGECDYMEINLCNRMGHFGQGS